MADRAFVLELLPADVAASSSLAASGPARPVMATAAASITIDPAFIRSPLVHRLGYPCFMYRAYLACPPCRSGGLLSYRKSRRTPRSGIRPARPARRVDGVASGGPATCATGPPSKPHEVRCQSSCSRFGRARLPPARLALPANAVGAVSRHAGRLDRALAAAVQAAACYRPERGTYPARAACSRASTR